MRQTAGSLSLTTLQRKKMETFRRKQRAARIHKRLSALLWLTDG